jgi:hypothetical protein
VTTTIEYEAYIHNDFPEDQVDQQGYARLRDLARNRGLQLVGDVTRVSDVPVVGMTVEQADGTTSITFVELDDPAAAGRVSDARRVRWEIQAEPVIATDPIKVKAVVLGPGALARAELPEGVTDQGSLVELAHGLGGEVTVLAFNHNGERVGYTYGVAIDDNTHELLLPPGAARLEVSRDPDEDDTEEGTTSD